MERLTSTTFSFLRVGQKMKVVYCQAQPKSKFSLAELAIKSDSNLHNNRGSIIQAEYEPQELFKGSWPKL